MEEDLTFVWGTQMPIMSKDYVQFNCRAKASYRILIDSLKNIWTEQMAMNFENEMIKVVNSYFNEVLNGSNTYNEILSKLNNDSFINYYKNSSCAAQFEIISIEFITNNC